MMIYGGVRLVTSLGKLVANWKSSHKKLKDLVSKEQGLDDDQLKIVKKIDDQVEEVTKHIDDIETELNSIWDDITPTQPLYRGTKIPRSFEIKVGNQKFWVHGNATEHIAEHLVVRGSPRLESQLLLTDFKNSIKRAVENGIKYDQIIMSGKWELKFAVPRVKGQYPTIIHAKFLGW